ncbi:hypothetical protein M422DRAFT_32233 [Sphaerobolus stellatus SS14]|uniref:Unplaced genomic scaffold SPHSTscaffold_68, whole genome shotgun sequence n=1 Tax=Sphaerobolus stellatus (strain SS14) TaxID=990650 RepID=A0A0C9V0H0_SPHS4|nr:hypothetical protein M422DRAFT_32233 [Sphaerobolus stellatus SS14]
MHWCIISVLSEASSCRGSLDPIRPACWSFGRPSRRFGCMDLCHRTPISPVLNVTALSFSQTNVVKLGDVCYPIASVTSRPWFSYHPSSTQNDTRSIPKHESSRSAV